MDEPRCDDAISELYSFIDGELDENMRLRIETHLNNCSPCLEAFDFETDLRKVIASRCRDRVPEDLRLRIMAALQQVDGQPPGESSDAT